MQWGVEIQGKLDKNKLQHPCPGQLPVPQGVLCLPQDRNGCDTTLVYLQSSWGARSPCWGKGGRTCSSWNNSFARVLTTGLTKMFQLLSTPSVRPFLSDPPASAWSLSPQENSSVDVIYVFEKSIKYDSF